MEWSENTGKNGLSLIGYYLFLKMQILSLCLAVGNVEKIAESLERGHAIGALLDSYVAGSYQYLFKNFRLNDLKEDLFSYGVVLMPTVMKYERCFNDYLTSRQDFIFHAISKNIIPLKVGFFYRNSSFFFLV